MQEIDTLSDDHCFLCGAELNDCNRSVEHVFPKWLLREAKLWNETSHQLNATLLPYRQCLIPCCKPCNSGPLSSLENEVRNAFGHGAAGLDRLDPTRLSLWMAKIYYGYLRRSHSLQADRANPACDRIITASAMQSLHPLQSFIQRIRLDDKRGSTPDSTFVCDVYSSGDSAADFDWLAATLIGRPGRERLAPAIALRHKGVGIISLFEDGGAQKKLFQSTIDKFAGIQLHRMQFDELACRCFYRHSLMRSRIDMYHQVADGPLTAIGSFPLDGYTWDEWDTEEYAMYLFRHLKERPHHGVTKLSDVFFDGNRVISYLYWPDGTPRVATADELH